MEKHQLLAVLKKACQGLLFPSETDAELEPFLWENGNALTPVRLVDIAGFADGTQVETMELAEFFYAVPKADKPAFDTLAHLLTEHLAGVKVYKIGEIDKAVYIVGKTEKGPWAGVKTQVVET